MGFDLPDRITTCNNIYKKLVFQCLNEVLCFILSSVVADSFWLRNPHLLKAEICRSV